MRIERVELVPFALRFREPYVTARGRLERRELLLVRLRADGVEGLGEAVPLALRGGPSLNEIQRQLDEGCRPRLEGAEVGAVEAMVNGCAESGAGRQALAAVEAALLDLAGKLADEPVGQLLGAAQVRPVATNATLVAGTPADVAADALRWAEDGFRTFKLKLGAGQDIMQVAAVREALGDDARIRVDANGTWNASEAAGVLAELEQLSVELAEQPCATLSDLARVRAGTETPIAADESVSSEAEARAALTAGACDMATAKLAKVGGIAETRAIAAILPVYLSSALDGPVGIAAAAHAAQLLPPGAGTELAHGLATARLFEGTVAAHGWELEGDQLIPPNAPGLGVEIDEAALSRARL